MCIASAGKKLGKGKEDFKEVGCLVVNENEEFLRKEWKDFYVNFTGKSKMDGKKKGIERKREEEW